MYMIVMTVLLQKQNDYRTDNTIHGHRLKFQALQGTDMSEHFTRKYIVHSNTYCTNPYISDTILQSEMLKIIKR